MIMEYLNGDVEGKQYGVNTPPYPLFPYPAGDTLNYPNHVDYSSRFCAAVNLGGAVAESWWIEPGQPPIISIGTKYDLTTPYDSGIVYVGVTRSFMFMDQKVLLINLPWLEIFPLLS